jgi:hypothetical protein
MTLISSSEQRRVPCTRDCSHQVDKRNEGTCTSKKDLSKNDVSVMSQDGTLCQPVSIE